MDLVNNTIIDDAIRHRDETADRVTRAIGALAEADEALKTAKEASERAIAGDGDPLEAEHALEAASRAQSVARRVLDAAQLALTEATAGVRTARGVAYQPVYQAGVSRRLEAARKADIARAALAEAQRDYEAGTDLISTALQNGTVSVLPVDPMDGAGRPVGTFAEESHRWIKKPNRGNWLESAVAKMTAEQAA